MAQFLREAARALAWMAAFVALGAGARALAAGAEPAAYPAAPMALPADPADEPRTWLVDGFNLMHAAVLRGRDRRDWWGPAARERVLELVRRLDAPPEAQVVVVFDGQRPADEPEQAEARPQVVFAASADEWLIRAVREASDPGRIAVVTADRQLADRARHRGARVIGPRAFRERCGGAA
jgi:predicted RNA-binding protein with PIN domain